MAGKITKILLVLAILQYALRADAQAVKATAEVLTQHEEQNGQTTWLTMAGSITKVLMVAGIFRYALSVDLPAVKVTEELLRQHEEQRSQEMAKLQKMEQRMQEQSRPTQESVLHSVCQQWGFWNCVEITLMLFGIYLLPSQKGAGSGSDSQKKTTSSAQEQMEEHKPLDKISKSLRPILEILQRSNSRGSRRAFPRTGDFPGALEEPRHGGACPPGVALVPEPELSRVGMDRENPREFPLKDAFYDYVNIAA